MYGCLSFIVGNHRAIGKKTHSRRKSNTKKPQDAKRATREATTEPQVAFFAPSCWATVLPHGAGGAKMIRVASQFKYVRPFRGKSVVWAC